MNEGPLKAFLGHAWHHAMQDYRELESLVKRSGISWVKADADGPGEGSDPDDPYDEAYTFMPQIDREIGAAECLVVYAWMYDVGAAGRRRAEWLNHEIHGAIEEGKPIVLVIPADQRDHVYRVICALDEIFRGGFATECAAATPEAVFRAIVSCAFRYRERQKTEYHGKSFCLQSGIGPEPGPPSPRPGERLRCGAREPAFGDDAADHGRRFRARPSRRPHLAEELHPHRRRGAPRRREHRAPAQVRRH